jgi:hypothetical protein
MLVFTLVVHWYVYYQWTQERNSPSKKLLLVIYELLVSPSVINIYYRWIYRRTKRVKKNLPTLFFW